MRAEQIVTCIWKGSINTNTNSNNSTLTMANQAVGGEREMDFQIAIGSSFAVTVLFTERGKSAIQARVYTMYLI